jgi:hypothetical protein
MARNGFLQILIGRLNGTTEIIRHFTTDRLYAQILSKPPEPGSVYNRHFLNSARVTGMKNEDALFRVSVQIKYTFQRVRVEDGKVTKIDTDLKTRYVVLHMVHGLTFPESKGSIYVRHCPSCGAAITDTLSIACSYCGSIHNDFNREWIVDSIEGFLEIANESKG